MDRLRRQLERATLSSVKGREAIARQRALIIVLETNGHDTFMAEDVLRTMTETQHLHEESERLLLEEFKSVAPEEWRSNYAENVERPPFNAGNELLSSLS